ncbi:hypothetical protein A3860_26855 [Niastella vici]|uniref:ABC transporter permease n=1 Tax=Niastella vici TaxID=1703345 RepID=A0A1V9FWD5_9BACT|nr:ABC transporter permease [Niastella vici]OQP62634.1 hypothetical protein A3860_26855 [Niastella vici]
MFRHQLRIFYINFKKHKSTVFINLFGLSTGLACSILICLWIYDECTIDKFHGKQLYKVMVNERQNDRLTTGEAGSGILGEALKSSFPEVQYVVTTTPAAWFRSFSLSGAEKDNVVKGAGNFVGKDYFNAFSYKLLQGNNDQVLADKRSIVISAGLARKLFNSTDQVVGKVIQWKWYSLSREAVVTGVYEDFPRHSSTQFDFLLPFDEWTAILKEMNGNTGEATINGGPFNKPLVLREGTSVNAFNKKIAGFIKSKFSQSTATLFLANYGDAYLYNNYENGVQTGGRIQYVQLFVIIAFCILLIACINFMNLSTAKAAERLKEIGVKKVLGVERGMLIRQFLGESVLLSFMALIIAVVLVVIVLPSFNALTGKQLGAGFDGWLIASVIGVALITGIIAGIYPAIYLSRLKPVLTLKGSFKGSVRDGWVRRGLVFFQFSVAVIFIVTIMVVYNQVQLIQSKKPGYDKDNVVYFEMQGKAAEQRDRFLAALKSIPGVVQASSITNTIVMPAGEPRGGVTWDDKNADDKIRFEQSAVNYELLETLGIEMAAGRTFSRNFGDSSAVVVNEAAVEAMGLTAPIGKKIKVWGKEKQIIGVARNFHFNSMHAAIKPFIFKLEPENTLLVMVKLHKNNRSGTIGAISKFYKQFNPGSIPDYKFLDEEYQQQYAFEMLIAKLSKYFTALAIIISCLGLFGLAAFTAEKRIKEIGIRKIVGASRFSIVYLLSADFTKIVLAALLVGLPISYLLAASWLNDFAYRIALTPTYFIAAMLVTLTIAWLTIALQTIKASMVNPVKCLKEN